MKVRMLTQQSGTRDGQPWPAPGKEVDVPDAEARALIRGGSAEPLDTEHGKVLVPPTGIHTPGTVAYDEPGVVNLVEVPTDGVANREGTKAALRTVADGGSDAQAPAGTGVQSSSGAALTDKGVQESVKSEEQAREDFGAPAPAKQTRAAKSKS